jgi:PAS domain S-box-containing protein
LSRLSLPPAPRSGTRSLLALIAALTAGVFLLDAATPRGLAVWVFYLVPLGLTALHPAVRLPLYHVTLVTPLVIVGFFLSPGPTPTPLHYLNRLIAASVIWAGALLTWRLQLARFAREERGAQLRLFIEHAPVALAMFDREMRYLAVSRRWLADYGLADTSVIGRSHYEVFPEIPERWRALHRRGLAGETLSNPRDSFTRLDGSVQRVRWELRPWYRPDGAVGGIVLFTEDITSQLAAQAAIEASEARLRLALEAAQMGTFDWEIPSGQIVWSRWHEELWGYRPGEFDGTWAGFTSRVHPGDLTRVEAEVARCRAHRIPYSLEFRVIQPDGSTRWVLGHGQFAFDEEGTPIRMRGVVMDVTPQHHHTEELARSAQQLAALTARLDQILETERARLSREIHDELGQLLTGVKMDLRWAERRLDQLFSDDRRVNPVLDRLAAAGELADLVIGAIQRIAAELRPGALDTLGLGETLVQEGARYADRAGIACQVEIPAEAPPLAPEVATALFRIFQEALTNVSRHAHASRVEVALRAREGECQLEIRDNGRGGRLDPTAPDALGLRGMVERARLVGAAVEFASTAGEGSTVSVRVPLAGLDRGAA